MPEPSVMPDKVAAPLLRVAAPSEVAPFQKVTVPVAEVGETDAVRVTAWPGLAGFGFAANTTEVC